jgi:neurotransmitter:Na+ symporter, NSS family
MSREREHWGSKLGFLMATAGSAIGLGSLWRFPYVIGQNGGGAFVLLYFLFTFLIGIPVFIAELVMGRNTQKCVVNAFSDLSKGRDSTWRMAGWMNVLTNFLILSYYSVVAGWALNYTFMSLSNFTLGKTPDEIRQVFDVVFTASDINIFWHFLFMLLTVGVVLGGVRKGIEHWSKILTPALLIILVGLFLFAITLPGFGKALHFTLYPAFDKLTPGGVLDALGMSFWTLSIGLGIVLTYGSYMKPTTDIPKTGFIIAIVSALVSLFAALMIFPIVFTFGFEPEAGPGLVFKTLPVLFSQLPATLIISTIFFVLFVFAALTSSISILEVQVASLMELFQWSRRKAVLLAGAGAFLLGIPSALAGSGGIFGKWKDMYGGKNFFDTLNYITGSWMMPISGLLFAVFVGWFMDKRIAKEEYLKGTKMVRFLRVWLFLIRWLAPIGIFIIILQESGIIDISKFFKS